MIDFPDTPRPASGTAPFFIDKGSILPGGLGATDQRVNRMGNRFGLAVVMPPMKGAAARKWVARLIAAQEEGGRIAWPRQGFDPGAPGSIVVDGSGQSGSTLAVKSANPNYRFREGQFFSIVTGDQHFVYVVAAETAADAAGAASLAVRPMLRAQHLDADVCNFGLPMIEGFVSGDERQWRLAVAHFIGIEFEIRERS